MTLAADNAAWDVSDSDMTSHCNGSVLMPQGNDGASTRMATLTNIGFDFDCAATTLYLGLKTVLATSTFFGAAGDISLVLNVVPHA